MHIIDSLLIFIICYFIRERIYLVNIYVVYTKVFITVRKNNFLFRNLFTRLQNNKNNIEDKYGR